MSPNSNEKRCPRCTHIQSWCNCPSMTPSNEAERTPEEWRPIPGFEGRYEASSLGRIRSLRYKNRAADFIREQPKILSTHVGARGYEQVCLGKGPNHLVHRLVLSAFAGANPDGLEAAHLDGDKKNNRPENLAWVTRSENMMHKAIHRKGMVLTAGGQCELR